MTQQCAHNVHLGVTCAGVSARTVDFLEDDGCLSDAETGTTVLFGNKGRQITRRRERVNKGLRIILLLIDFAPILVGEAAAKVAYRGTQLPKVHRHREHKFSLEIRSNCRFHSGAPAAFWGCRMKREASFHFVPTFRWRKILLA